MLNSTRTKLTSLVAVAAASSIVLVGGQQSAVPQNASRTAEPPAPTPESVIGWKACADRKLATYEQVAEYYRKLDDGSDRMRLFEIGKSTEGRTMLVAAISSERNIRHLGRYRRIARRLALADDLTERQARRLSRRGKPIVWIDYGIHSTETAAHQVAPQTAYDLVTGESRELRTVRKNVITLLMPNLNPDGGTQVAKWYRRHQGKEWELDLPELYQKYAGHDNNRDWFMFNLNESRNVAKQLYHRWFPQVVYDNHQSGPYPSRIFVPPFSDPLNPKIHPLVPRGASLVGSAMTRRLDEENKSGAISDYAYDMWWNGGMRSAPFYHNMIGILTETSHTSPTPTYNDPDDFPATFSNGISTRHPSVFYPNPYRGGEWHLRDSCEYMLTTARALLDLAVEKGDELLYDNYRMGRDAIAAGRGTTYVIPAEQRDFPTAVRLVNALRWGNVQVQQATEPFTAGGRSYDKGSFVISGAQAFRPHLADLLNPQHYPKPLHLQNGELDQPYDIAGWTLPLQMGVRVDKLQQRVSAQTRDVGFAEVIPGEVTAESDVAYALDPRVNNAAEAVNRLLDKGATVWRSTSRVRTGSGRWPAGTFLVEARPGTRHRLRELATELGLTVTTVGSVPDSARELTEPRIGLYHGWGGNSDEGWTRYVFEHFGFDYSRLHDSDVRAGNLGRYDVIVLPDDSLEDMRDGIEPGEMPARYTGGMTEEGVANLEEFVRSGGVLVAMDSAAELPIKAFGVPATDVTDEAGDEFNIPGSLLKLRVDKNDPVGYGMPRRSTAFYSSSPAFDVAGKYRVARYPNGDLLQSGYSRGEEVIRGKTAVARMPVDDGQVVLLGFRTQFRAQSHGTYKLLFNSLYLGGLGSGSGEKG